jgi:hypothetical protein
VLGALVLFLSRYPTFRDGFPWDANRLSTGAKLHDSLPDNGNRHMELLTVLEGDLEEPCGIPALRLHLQKDEDVSTFYSGVPLYPLHLSYAG